MKVQQGQNSPIVTGISPGLGPPGTLVTIRGERLGHNQSDLLALLICGTDCLMTAKWKSPAKIIARVGPAKRGAGEIIIVTRSGGRGASNVHFHVNIEQIGPLQESTMWVDESKTVPGRSNIRTNISEVSETCDDVLGIKSNDRIDSANANLTEKSNNLRMDTFNPAQYLVENYKKASISDLRIGLKNLKYNIDRREKASKNVQKTHLYSLINCVDALAKLHKMIEDDASKPWQTTADMLKKISLATGTAHNLFSDVLSRKDQADTTRSVLSLLTRFRFIFFLCETIDEQLSRKPDYSAIINDYMRARTLIKDNEIQLFKEVAQVLSPKIDLLKKSIREKILDPTISYEDQGKLVKYSRILDPDSDPIWDTLVGYHRWLDEIFWKLQKKYYEQALAYSQIPKQGQHRSDNQPEDFTPQYSFVVDLLSVLTDKLSSFWQLAQNFTDLTSGWSQERRDDVDQMLINSIKCCSWILLNVLVPNSLPQLILDEYRDQFVSWPKVKIDANISLLFQSLSNLRNLIKSLLEQQFTRTHLSPLIELCTTVRLTFLEMVLSRAAQKIVNLGMCDSWTTDVLSIPPRTTLPDLYETEINEQLSSIQQILSNNLYNGELDLFMKDRMRKIIIDLFVSLLTSLESCYHKVFKLSSSEMPRPETLAATTIDDAKKELPTSEVSGRKLLIAANNINYVISHSLVSICRRLSERGVKFTDTILKNSRQKLSLLRQSLIEKYINIKRARINSIVESADYSFVLQTYDISDYIKEIIIFVVLIQSELCLNSPHLINQIKSSLSEYSLKRILHYLSSIEFDSCRCQTQIIIDLSVFEEAFSSCITSAMSSALNSIRAKLMSELDQDVFRKSMSAFRTNFKYAIDSLNTSS